MSQPKAAAKAISSSTVMVASQRANAAGRSDAELAAALAAALRRDGPTVIDARVDPAGYPLIMDLSRGEAGRQPVPGLSQPARPE